MCTAAGSLPAFVFDGLGDGSASKDSPPAGSNSKSLWEGAAYKVHTELYLQGMYYFVYGQ